MFPAPPPNVTKLDTAGMEEELEVRFGAGKEDVPAELFTFTELELKVPALRGREEGTRSVVSARFGHGSVSVSLQSSSLEVPALQGRGNDIRRAVSTRLGHASFAFHVFTKPSP